MAELESILEIEHMLSEKRAQMKWNFVNDANALEILNDHVRTCT